MTVWQESFTGICNCGQSASERSSVGTFYSQTDVGGAELCLGVAQGWRKEQDVC